MLEKLSKQFHVNGEKDVEILLSGLNNPTTTGRNPHKVKRSPWTVPAIIAMMITTSGIMAGLMYIPAFHKMLGLLFA